MSDPALITALVGLAATLAALVGVWVRLRELKTNSGNSLRDVINRIEQRQIKQGERIAALEGRLEAGG